jgi:hypothetical protein
MALSIFGFNQWQIASALVERKAQMAKVSCSRVELAGICLKQNGPRLSTKPAVFAAKAAIAWTAGP